MTGIRRNCSLLISHGQTDAYDLPLGILWEEATIITDRINNQMVTEATLLHSAISTVLGGRPAFDNFNKMIKGLTSNG